MGTAFPIVLAILAQLSLPIADPGAKARAQMLLTEGSSLYEKGDYASAIEKFSGAYAAYPSPKLMFNIGQANRDLGRPVEALLAFEKFLTGELDASPETTADARRSLAELRAKLGQIRIACDSEGAEVRVDGKSVGLTPLPEPIWATPGRHQVTARSAHSAPAMEDVVVMAGSLGKVTLRLQPRALSRAATPIPSADGDANLTALPTAPAELARSQPTYKKWWFWSGAGAVVVGGSVTAFLLLRRSNDPCGGVGYACLEIR